jgi:putative intracellular protease/amidase
VAVYVFLSEAFADWEIGYLLPELLGPPDPGMKKNVREVVTFGLTEQPVRSMGNLNVSPDTGLEHVDPDRVEALILPGGMSWKKFSNPRLDELVKNLVNREIIVAAICAATGYLGRLGLLNEVEHTSNSLGFLKWFAPTYTGESHYQTAPAVCDRQIITASGLAAVEFTQKVLEALHVYDASGLTAWYRAFKYGEEPTLG